MILRRAAVIAVALIPWTLTLYLHYWLEHGEVWEVHMAYRALISVVLLAAGMIASLLLYSRLAKLPGRRKPDA